MVVLFTHIGYVRVQVNDSVWLIFYYIWMGTDNNIVRGYKFGCCRFILLM